jgi:hypothetical protein
MIGNRMRVMRSNRSTLRWCDMGRAAKLKLSRFNAVPKLGWGNLQTPFTTLASFGINQVGSILAGSDCCDRASALQEIFPRLKAQVGVVLVRGYSDLPGHDGKECWDSLFQGHCWLVDPESGNIVDPSLDSFAEGSQAMADFRPVRPLAKVQARVVPHATTADCHRILGSTIDNLPTWGPFIDADLLYVPGFLDSRYLINPDSDGTWHVMAYLSREGRGFDMKQVDERLSAIPVQERKELGIRTKTKDETNSIALVLDPFSSVVSACNVNGRREE